jgi:hypothetical protein
MAKSSSGPKGWGPSGLYAGLTDRIGSNLNQPCGDMTALCLSLNRQGKAWWRS